MKLGGWRGRHFTAEEAAKGNVTRAAKASAKQTLSGRFWSNCENRARKRYVTLLKRSMSVVSPHQQATIGTPRRFPDC